MTKQNTSPSPQPQGKRRVLPDLLLIGVVVLLALLALVLYKCTGKTGDAVVVLIDGVETATYDLSTDRVVEIRTPGGGVNILCIQDGVVTIQEANCPDGICAAHSPISKTNDTIVCLPHKLVVKVVSRQTGDAPDLTV